MKIDFNELFLKKTRSGKCATCGKRTRRIYKAWQTKNFFNLNNDGIPKSTEEIMKELEAEIAGLVTAPLLCTICESKKKDKST